MKAHDLIIGKCYVYDKDVILIFRGIKAETSALGMESEYFKTVRYEFSLPNIRLATAEEEHWYNECVKKDTYVPREIAMASFAKTVSVSTNPAYVRCTHSHDNRFKKGNVYKTYPGVHKEGNVYIKPEIDSPISDYPLMGGYWKFEPCEGPETSVTAPPESMSEVFGKFIIGNIVVSLRNNTPYREEGDMFTILPMSKQDVLYYKPSTNSSDPGDWRLATTKECIAYHNGVKNIKQMSDPTDVLVQTNMSQTEACGTCKFAGKCSTAPHQGQCTANGGMHYPKVESVQGKSEQSGFLKDEYIVTTRTTSSQSFPENYVFKQRMNFEYLKVYKDAVNIENGSSHFMFSNKQHWRYATTQEIMEYDIQGKPVDVENNSVKCNSAKPYGYDLMNVEEFKRDVMKVFADGTPHGGVSIPLDALPEAWYMIVDQENILDAEIWRWDGNDIDARLEIGQLIGVPKYGGKGHNPGKSTEQFGTQINYNLFKKHVLTKERKVAMITKAFPIGSCVVVTKGSYGKNGKENHCYKVIEHTGIGTGDISLKYESCNSIGLSHVRVRSATASETTRYQREGKPYDITSGEPSVTNYDPNTFESAIPNTETDPYAGKSLEEMLVICKKMFPKGCKYRKKDDSVVHILEDELIIQTAGAVSNNEKGISNIGLPWFFFNGTMRVELVSAPESTVLGVNVHKSSDGTTSWSHKQPDKSASDAELLAYCKAMYPPGTVLQGGYIITQELVWESTNFISHSGIGIVYNRREHTFAQIIGQSMIKENSYGEPLKTLEDLPKKAKMSDVSALVKHQEPVIVNSKKAKRSKLVIINK